MVADGTQSLVATVKDASGQTGSTTVSIITNNGVTGSPAPSPSPSPSPSPTPTPSPTTGSLRVSITAPKAAATVSGTTWAVMWVEGQSGTSNTFQLFANGKLVASQVTSSRGPVSLPWVTTSTANGPVTLEGRVKDAASQTGSASINVTVAN